MTPPSIDGISELHGRIYAMLSPSEEATLDFYVAQGRKFDVDVRIMAAEEAGEGDVERVWSKQEEAQRLKASNSRVVVSVGENARTLWRARNAVENSQVMPPADNDE